MGRPRQVTDEQIIEAARRCFVTQGIQIAVQVIADELDLSHAAIFQRFGTKEALMVAALGPPKTLPFAALLCDGPDARDARVQLGELGRVLMDYFERIGTGWSLLQAAGIGLDKVFAGRDRPAPLEAYDEMRAWLRRAHKRGLLGPCSPDVLAWTFLGALHYRVFQAGIPQSGVARMAGTEVDALVAMLWSGVCAPTRASTPRARRPATPK